MLSTPVTATNTHDFTKTTQLIPLELKEYDIKIDYKPLIEVIRAAIELLQLPDQTYAQIVENKIIINTGLVYSEISRKPSSWGILIKSNNEERVVTQELPFNTDPILDQELSKILPQSK
jgi:hypothetical protein